MLSNPTFIPGPSAQLRDGLGVLRVFVSRLRRHGLALACCGLMLLAPAAFAVQNTMTLNFKDTDINAVIGAVAEMTGKNFIVDPRVKGKVTIISSRPMKQDEVYQVFLSVLKVHGFAAIPSKNIIKIVPEVTAKQDDIPTVTAKHPGHGDQVVTRVIEVKNVDAAQLVPILRPLVPQTGHLAAYPPSNVLIISDSADNIERLSAIISRIDTVGDEAVEIIPLKHASATEVVRILTSLEQQDVKAKGAAAKINIIADERSNSVLLGGDRGARKRLRDIISHLDSPVEIGGDTQVVYLRYANAKDLVTVLTGVGQSITAEQKAAQKTAAAGKISVQADEATYALVITAPPDVFRSLRSVIQQLDVRRAQVLVEGVIAEVTADKAAELGVQWVFDGSAQNNPVGVVNFAGSGSGLQGLLATPPQIGDGLTLGLGNFTSSTFRFGALVRALAGDTSTNILSTPSLVTLDNEEAEIVVGQNVPFLTGQYSNTGGGTTPTNPFQTIQRQDVGLTLKIKPQINEGNAIKLDVQQEVSSIAPTTTGASDIITNKRSIKTSVMVDDGQIVVLGGLISDNLTESEQKVPGLGDIPVLGWLFRYKKTTKSKTNLMVFLHPVILRDPALQASYTGEKYNYIRAQQLAIRQRGVALVDNNLSPLLPEMKDYLRLPPPYDESKPVSDSDALSKLPPPPAAPAAAPPPGPAQ